MSRAGNEEPDAVQRLRQVRSDLEQDLTAGDLILVGDTIRIPKMTAALDEGLLDARDLGDIGSDRPEVLDRRTEGYPRAAVVR
jgi:hypothetical protein